MTKTQTQTQTQTTSQPGLQTATLAPFAPAPVITGFPGAARAQLARALGGAPLDLAALQDWRAADATVPGSAPAVRLIGTYSAPWEALTEGESGRATEQLAEWMAWQTALLSAWQQRPGEVMLLNTGRLHGAVALTGASAATAMALADALAGLAPGRPAPGRGALFAWMAPEAWEIYEALESCAWLDAREPEYRSALPALDQHVLQDVLEAWRALRQLPLTIRHQARKHAALIAGATAEQDRLQALLLQASAEQERMAAGHAALAGREQAAVAAAAAAEARAQQLDARLQECEVQLKADAAIFTERLAHSQAEAAHALLQCQELQAELGTHVLEKRLLIKKITDNTRLFRRARDVVHRLIGEPVDKALP